MRTITIILTLALCLDSFAKASNLTSNHKLFNKFSHTANLKVKTMTVNHTGYSMSPFITVATNRHNYTTSDGLVNNLADAIAIDSHNVIWIGTLDGVSKFDGINWTTYTQADGLVNNNINSITIDSQGNIWFGTGNGVSEFNGTSWINYDSINSGLAGNWVWDITFDNQGNAWFGTDGYGVSMFNGNKWITYNSINSGLGNNSDNNVYTIAFDLNGIAWFATDYGVTSFDGNNWATYGASNGLVTDFVSSIAVDSLNNIWLGTDNGVFEFNNQNWTNYNSSNSGLTNDTIAAISFDNIGNLWVGTNDQGISKFDGTNWTIYSKSASVGNNIAIDNQGNKWFPTFTGLLEFNDSKVINVNSMSQIVNFQIISNTTWQISGIASWLSLSADTGTNNAIITVNINANGSSAKRSDTIYIQSLGLSDFLIINQSTLHSGAGLSNITEFGVTVYPNPVNDHLFISIPDIGNSYSIYVYSVSGTEIFSTNIQSNIIDINMNNYPAGIYILKLNTSDGVVTKKIVKN